MNTIMFNVDPLKAKRLKSPVNREEFINISKLNGKQAQSPIQNTQVKNKGMLQEVGRRVNWEIRTDTYALLCIRQIIFLNRLCST